MSTVAQNTAVLCHTGKIKTLANEKVYRVQQYTHPVYHVLARIWPDHDLADLDPIPLSSWHAVQELRRTFTTQDVYLLDPSDHTTPHPAARSGPRADHVNQGSVLPEMVCHK